MKTLGTLPPVHKNKTAQRYLAVALKPFFSFAPTGEGLKKRHTALNQMVFDRDRIFHALSEQNPAGHPALKKIKSPASVFVTTGHQPCLGGGPLFVAYKILTAVKLADWVEKNLKVPAIPLFWIANDDEDIEEVTSSTAPGLIPERFDPGTYQGVVGGMETPGTRYARLPKIAAKNWGDYHRQLIQWAFGPMGLLLADPLSPATQTLRRPFFDALLPKVRKVREGVLDAGQGLRGEGLKPQVKVREDDQFMFLLKNGKRERFTADQLDRNDIPLSSALSRLASMEFSLPLLCDVAGPSEIAYHAQTLPFYTLLQRTMPVIFPRFSATLVRQTEREILTTSGLSPAEVVRNRKEAENRLGESAIPLGAAESLARHFNAVETLFKGLEGALSQADPRLAGPARAAAQKAAGTREYLRRKLIRFGRREAFTRNPALSRAFDFLFPGSFQERVFNFLYFMESDPGFTGGALSAVDPFDFQHRILEWEEK